MPEAKPGQYVLLSVIDNGIGMTEEVKQRLFDPFFTTKEKGQGSGLGLAMVYGFVDQSHGHITVESVPGVGSAFTVMIPLVSLHAAADEQPAAPVQRGTTLVLVTHDAALATRCRRQIAMRSGRIEASPALARTA